MNEHQLEKMLRKHYRKEAGQMRLPGEREIAAISSDPSSTGSSRRRFSVALTCCAVVLLLVVGISAIYRSASTGSWHPGSTDHRTPVDPGRMPELQYTGCWASADTALILLPEGKFTLYLQNTARLAGHTAETVMLSTGFPALSERFSADGADGGILDDAQELSGSYQVEQDAVLLYTGVATLRYTAKDGTLVASDGTRLTSEDTLPGWALLARYGGDWHSAEGETLFLQRDGVAYCMSIAKEEIDRGNYLAEMDSVIFKSDRYQKGYRYAEGRLISTEDDSVLERIHPMSDLGFGVLTGGAVFTPVMYLTSVKWKAEETESRLTAEAPEVFEMLDRLDIIPAKGDFQIRLNRAFPSSVRYHLYSDTGEPISSEDTFELPREGGVYYLRLDIRLQMYDVISDSREYICWLALRVEDGYESSDFVYQNIRNREIILYQYTGSEKNLVIPAKIDGVPVKRVEYTVFNNSDIVSLAIPDSVEYLDFLLECSALRRINSEVDGVWNIPGTVKHFGGITRCAGVVELNIAQGVLSIGSCSQNPSLKRVTVPDSVTGTVSFVSCPVLECVVLGNGISRLEPGCFAGSDSLSSLTLGSGISVIRKQAFASGTNLREVTYACTRRVWESIDIEEPAVFANAVFHYGELDIAPAGYEVSEYNFSMILALTNYRYSDLWCNFGYVSREDGAFRLRDPLPDGEREPCSVIDGELVEGSKIVVAFAVDPIYGDADYDPDTLAVVSLLLCYENDRKDIYEDTQPIDVELPVTVTERGCEILLDPLIGTVSHGDIVSITLVYQVYEAEFAAIRVALRIN